MAEKRLIAANTLRERIEEWMRELKNQDNSFSGFVRESTLDDVLDYIDTAPTAQPEFSCQKWHPTSEIPPLAKRNYCDDGEPFVFYESAQLLLLMRDGDMKTGWFNRSGTGDCWMDEDGQTYNHRIAYWMELPEPPEGVPHD